MTEKCLSLAPNRSSGWWEDTSMPRPCMEEPSAFQTHLIALCIRRAVHSEHGDGFPPVPLHELHIIFRPVCSPCRPTQPLSLNVLIGRKGWEIVSSLLVVLLNAELDSKTVNKVFSSSWCSTSGDASRNHVTASFTTAKSRLFPPWYRICQACWFSKQPNNLNDFLHLSWQGKCCLPTSSEACGSVRSLFYCTAVLICSTTQTRRDKIFDATRRSFLRTL